MELTHRVFGRTPEGVEIGLYTITNRNDVSIQLLSYGATLASVRTLDAHDRIGEITLGFDAIDGYFGAHPYFGSTVGRVANRIARGKFTLDGVEYTLARNDGENHLHGGKRGFDHVLWEDSPFSKSNLAGVRFTYVSRDGEEGYPGTLTAHVTYTLNDQDQLLIEYEARTDKPTPVNLTNHTYWNLRGAGEGDVLDHRVTIYADEYLPVDAGLIPTGERRKVSGTPFDFKSEKRIGDDIEAAGGYDHCFVLRRRSNGLQKCARVYEPTTGRGIEIQTTQPGIQFYTGNMLTGLAGRGGKSFPRRSAFCLETQGFPDAVNRPDFPSVVLRPGDTYLQTTKVRFFCQ